MGKVYSVKENLSIYSELAENYAQSGELLKALSISFSALKLNPNSFNLELDIARLYADMGLFSLSNKYLYKYLVDAPEELYGVAYQELAVNYYYLDDFWASGYYFHEKMKKDGFINSDNLDEEITSFVSETEKNTGAYFVAYPFDKADYSYRIKAGKRALALGDSVASSIIYSSIPKECRDEDVSGDLAVSYMLNGDDEKVISECKESISRYGENVTAYTILSNFYREKGNKEKAEYYYNKALELRFGNEDESYKIATCAIELGDNLTALKCLDDILSDRVYDDLMSFYRGIAKLNLGNPDGAYRDFQLALMLNPSEDIYKYYLDFANTISSGSNENDYLFPLKYQREYPQKIAEENVLIIKQTASGKPPKKISLEKMMNIIKWGLYSNREEIYKDCFMILSVINGNKPLELLRELLIDPEVNEYVKSKAFMTMMFCNVREKIPVVTGPFFSFVKPRKLIFEDKDDGAIFISAYAMCMTKCVFSGIDETAKIAFIANKIYKNNKKEIIENDLKPDEIATLFLCATDIKKLKDDEQVCKAFNVQLEKIKPMLEKIRTQKKEEKDDKNN